MISTSLRWKKFHHYEHHIKFDHYTKALTRVGAMSDAQGRLTSMVEQVQVFEQNFIRAMKDLSPACEFYAKMRTLDTATEQATQTFAEKQCEESFHSQLEALVVTWLTNKLPDMIRKRAHNRRPEPSARILSTGFSFTLFPQPGDQANHLGNIARNPTSVSANPTDVLANVENWRTSIQRKRN